MTRARTVAFDIDPVLDWIGQEMEVGRLTGGVVEVRLSGQPVLTQAFGAGGPDGSPATLTTQYWIASMTKPLVCVAAMRLVDDGLLSLSDPVAAFVPGFGTRGVLTSDGLRPVGAPPTVLNLMRHTSGLTYGFSGDELLHQLYTKAGVYDFRSNNARMAATLADLPLMYEPGTVFEYGMSTDMLGRVVEVVTGLPLDQALTGLILNPLGMKDTGFCPDPARLAVMPQALVDAGVAPPFDVMQRWWSGGAGLCSTLADYMAFATMIANGGRFGGVTILRPEMLAEMCRDHLPPEISYGTYSDTLGITAPWKANGLGFGLGLAVRTAHRSHLPGGLGEVFWPGVSGANFWVDPQFGLIAVLLTHAPEHRAAHRLGFRQAVYAGLSGGN